MLCNIKPVPITNLITTFLPKFQEGSGPPVPPSGSALDSIRYPTADYNISFLAQKFSRVYGDVAEFRTKFFNMDDLISNPNITPSDYKTLYPLFLFDVSKQSEKLKYSTTDIQIEMHFSRNVAAGTQAYAVTISDRLINFQSDGNKFSVVI